MKYLLISLALSSFAGAALAEPTCTQEPKDKWMAEAAMQKKLADEGYKTKVFKTTKGNCYELYGWNKDGKKVEIYFNPVDGQPVKQRIEK
ncbi:MAG: PepSY domain-containing protein [Chitinivorax sp.]|jgi:hypothetical protein